MNLYKDEIIQFLDILPDGFIIFDTELRYIYINQTGANLLNKKKEDLIGNKMSEVFPGSENLEFYKSYQLTILDKQQREWEEFLPPYKRWFYNIITSFENGLIVFFRDINIWKTNQEQLLLANERFRLVSKATDDVVWDWDLVNDKMYWNENFKTVFGYAEEEISNTINDWTIRIHPEDKDSAIKSLYEVVASKKINWHSEYRFKKNDNTYAQILDRGYVIRDNQGKAIRMIGAMSDITERVKAQDLAKRLAAIIEVTSDLVSFGDENNNPQYINQSGLKLLGLNTIEEFKSLPLNTHHPEDALRILRNVALPTAYRNGTWKGETTIITKEGKIIPVSQVLTVHKSEDGKLNQLSTIIRDISEIKKSENELLKLNKQLRFLGTKLNSVVEEERARIGREIHDELGQQLILLKLDISNLRKIENKENEQINKKLDETLIQIDNSIKTARRLALDIHPHLVRDLGLIEAIEWYVTQLTERIGIKLFLNLEQTIDIQNTDIAIAIFRIIQEAISNVIKHAHASELSLSLTTQKSFYQLIIEDNGIGFNKIENEKYSLGLTGMEERAYILDAQINIKSTKNIGTIITVNIPI